MTTEEIRAPASHATMADVRVPQERQSTLGQRIYRYRFVYLMLVPTFALLLTFNYYPAFMGLYRAFFKWDIGLQPEFLALGNFEKLFIRDDIFLKSLRHVSLLTSWRVISAVTFPFIVAELIFNLRSNVHKYTYRVLTILPAVVPGIVILLLWQFIYDGTHGLLNAFLEGVGLEDWQQPWLGSPKTALYAVTFMGFPWVGGVTVLIYLAGLQGISDEVIDSSLVDGCSGLRRIFAIDIPLILGQFKLIIVLAVIGGLQGWVAVFVMTAGGPGTASMVPGLWMYNNAFLWNKMGYASAIGMFLFVLIMCLTILNVKFVKTGDY
ncbi:MAG: sugar ABC transporter permease [Caldilineaceae bacterium SB0668_bin_21]|nr:sugar ABC transporter permease [Caldilineaceae bacterium SB0668_bin_21]MYC21567.1 sugar ABC transporter permease [Caldilineaceae bacterium SB0662_bin_25]